MKVLWLALLSTLFLMFGHQLHAAASTHKDERAKLISHIAKQLQASSEHKKRLAHLQHFTTNELKATEQLIKKFHVVRSKEKADCLLSDVDLSCLLRASDNATKDKRIINLMAKLITLEVDSLFINALALTFIRQINYTQAPFAPKIKRRDQALKDLPVKLAQQIRTYIDGQDPHYHPQLFIGRELLLLTPEPCRTAKPQPQPPKEPIDHSAPSFESVYSPQLTHCGLCPQALKTYQAYIKADLI